MKRWRVGLVGAGWAAGAHLGAHNLIDGCEVLVMRDNTSDIRPLPEFHDGPGKLTPLGGQ